MVEVGTGSLDTLRFIRTLHKKMETHAASIMKKERERDGQNFDARKVENVSSFLGRLVLPTLYVEARHRPSSIICMPN